MADWTYRFMPFITPASPITAPQALLGLRGGHAAQIRVRALHLARLPLGHLLRHIIRAHALQIESHSKGNRWTDVRGGSYQITLAICLVTSSAPMPCRRQSGRWRVYMNRCTLPLGHLLGHIVGAHALQVSRKLKCWAGRSTLGCKPALALEIPRKHFSLDRCATARKSTC